MVSLRLIDNSKKIGHNMFFTLGKSKDPKAEWPIYVIDRVTTDVENKETLYQEFLKNNMIPSSYMYTSLKNIDFHIVGETGIKNIIFDSPLLKEQSSYMIYSGQINQEATYFQQFLTSFLKHLNHYKVKEYLKQVLGENHPLYKLSSQYIKVANLLEKQPDREDLIVEMRMLEREIGNQFSDYSYLRKNYDINQRIEMYLKRYEEEKRQKEILYQKLKDIESSKKEQSTPESILILPSKEEFSPLKRETAKRSLCFLIGSKVEPLVLLENEKDLLDDEIINQFHNSDEIRKKFKSEIEKYCQEHQNYLLEIMKSLKKPNYRGQIVILEKDKNNEFKRTSDGQYLRIAVIYSDIWKEIRKLSINIPKMCDLITKDSYQKQRQLNYTPLFSNYEMIQFRAAIKKNKSGIKTPYETKRKEWIKSIDSSSTKYDQLRLLKHYLEKGQLPRILESTFVIPEKTSNYTPEFSPIETYKEDEEFLEEDEYNRAYYPGQVIGRKL